MKVKYFLYKVIFDILKHAGNVAWQTGERTLSWEGYGGYSFGLGSSLRQRNSKMAEQRGRNRHHSEKRAGNLQNIVEETHWAPNVARGIT